MPLFYIAIEKKIEGGGGGFEFLGRSPPQYIEPCTVNISLIHCTPLFRCTAEIKGADSMLHKDTLSTSIIMPSIQNVLHAHHKLNRKGHSKHKALLY